MWEEPGQSCRIHTYTVYTPIGEKGRCHTRGDLQDHRKQERVQVRDPLWIWNPWGRTHEVQNRSNQWLHKMGLGPTKIKKKKTMIMVNVTIWQRHSKSLILYPHYWKIHSNWLIPHSGVIFGSIKGREIYSSSPWVNIFLLWIGFSYTIFRVTSYISFNSVQNGISNKSEVKDPSPNTCQISSVSY